MLRDNLRIQLVLKLSNNILIIVAVILLRLLLEFLLDSQRACLSYQLLGRLFI